MWANEYDRSLVSGQQNGCVTIKAGDKAQQERARIFGQRIAAKAPELFGA
jgi:hypothetical protein